ncbi:triose-phosphate isomerase [Streptomyces noursei]|uniref:triose-phosphate isomerase n=1 Tax=Streptomyces noursei TaxID=1971 RepID=UPI000C9B2DF0|nr:triose-phosphate isomerase [Streptomyces noursei]
MSDVIPEAVPLHHATAPAARAAPRPVVGVSLKLYFGLARTRAWLAEVAALDAVLAGLPRPVDLFVLPSFPALADARELLSGTRIGYGAQEGEQRAGDPATAAEETLAQVRAALAGAAPGSEVIVAYEPVWAIGAREPAPAGHVRAVATALRGALHDHDVRGRLIYGGTAGPGTHGELAGAVDGLFLGRLAHDTEGLRKVLEELSGG